MSALIAILVKAVPAIVTRIFVACASEKMIEWLLFYVAGLIVKSTKTKHDDLFLEKITEAYKNKPK